MLKPLQRLPECPAPQSCMVEKRCSFSLQALKTFGDDIGIAFSGAEDVALVEYAHLTGRPFRVFRWAFSGAISHRQACDLTPCQPAVHHMPEVCRHLHV